MDGVMIEKVKPCNYDMQFFSLYHSKYALLTGRRECFLFQFHLKNQKTFPNSLTKQIFLRIQISNKLLIWSLKVGNEARSLFLKIKTIILKGTLSTFFNFLQKIERSNLKLWYIFSFDETRVWKARIIWIFESLWGYSGI